MTTAPSEPTYTARSAAAYVGVEPGTWRAYVSRGQAPKADGHHDARTPYWLKATLDTYLDERRRRAADPNTENGDDG